MPGTNDAATTPTMTKSATVALGKRITTRDKACAARTATATEVRPSDAISGLCRAKPDEPRNPRKGRETGPQRSTFLGFRGFRGQRAGVRLKGEPSACGPMADKYRTLAEFW